MRRVNKVFDRSYETWRAEHAGDPCTCGHPRSEHYDASGAQRGCRGDRHWCHCRSFQLDKEVDQA